jgi:(p)ppGpp synthase/HD superfamily hydrolase
MTDNIGIARAIATIAHSGQLDKAGQPYIDHPRRVAEALERTTDYRPWIIAAAWLHDVIEDTDVNAELLIEAGVDRATVNIVETLTHVKGESNGTYWERIKKSSAATDIKLADIADNLDPRRLAKLDDETIARLVRKYAQARAFLEGVTPPTPTGEPR